MPTNDSMLHFPTGFRWGTATSSHQVEGHQHNNDWWAAEQDGGFVYQDQRSGDACDWWHNAEADFDRMAAMGLNAHRLSIEWSRIQPKPDQWDAAALLRYREMLQGLRARGIEPMVTLHHFTSPIWMAEAGGWENENSPIWFAAYVRQAVTALGDLAHLWVTFNEPMILLGQAYVFGAWPPFKRSLDAALQAGLNLVRAHAAAYHAIHELQPDATVGLAKHMVVWAPHRPWLPTDHVVRQMIDRVSNHTVLNAVTRGVLQIPGRRTIRIPQAAHTLDWLGVNYYQRYRVGAKIRAAIRNLLPGISDEVIYQVTRPGALKGPGPWGEIHARGLFESLRAAAGYGVPLFVTENGMPDENDEHRPAFIVTHLQQLWQAIQRDIPIMGYYHWSLIDNFEWDKGYDPAFRFGLFAVDFETQARAVRDSGRLYSGIVTQGGISPELAQQYAPGIAAALF